MATERDTERSRPGLGIDDGEPGQALTVVRGARRAYSFTLGLPVQVEAEDVPDEVTAVLLDARVMYELLVEGSSTTEAPHAVRFGRRLAEATRVALLDSQTDQVWTRGKLRTPPRAEARPRSPTGRTIAPRRRLRRPAHA